MVAPDFYLLSGITTSPSKAKMPKGVTFQIDPGESRTSATYKMELFVTLANGFQLLAGFQL